jgi:uncharacterized protein (DUF1501 family)
MDRCCTRRSFLKGGAFALLGFGSIPRFLVRTAHAREPGSRSRVLIAVFQRGAVDGLSMIVPHGERAYYDSRSTIAIQRPSVGNPDTAIDLDGFFGFHPALKPLEPLWNARRLAVIHACGSPHATRSHFDAQDYMEAGSPGIKTTPDGWLARVLRARPLKGPSPLRGVALGARLPRSLRGDKEALAFSDLSEFDVKSDGQRIPGALDARRGFEALYEQGAQDLLYGTGREAFEAMKILKAANPQRLTPANGAEYPRGRFGDSLRQIAQLIKANVGLEVAFTDLGGWDTHVHQGNETGPLRDRLNELAQGFAALDRDLGDGMADVVVLTMSEFGRTIRENGSGGTDHGHGTAMLLLGGPVRGGKVYGAWPGLEREQLFDGRDLAVTADFRHLFSEIAVRHLSVPEGAPLFPGSATPAGKYLGILS